MPVLRAYLIAASLGVATFLLVVILQAYTKPTFYWPNAVEFGLGIATVVSLYLNAYYLWQLPGSGQPGRIRRLFSLWLDAKEGDLRARAKRD